MKQKAIGLLKYFKKLRTQIVKEPSTIAKPISYVSEADRDIEETYDEVIQTNDFIGNISPPKDATIESHTEDTRNPDVTIHTANVDTNINTSAPTSTLILETKSVIPPEGPSSKSTQMLI